MNTNTSTIKEISIINTNKSYINIINDLVDKLSSVHSSLYEDIMWHFVNDNNEIECAFLLDVNGTQISDTIILQETLNDKMSVLFAPAVKGDKHEIKNYYYAVKEDIENPFVSDWYTSGATGKLCKTISSKFKDKNGDTIIVCADIKYNK